MKINDITRNNLPLLMSSAALELDLLRREKGEGIEHFEYLRQKLYAYADYLTKEGNFMGEGWEPFNHAFVEVIYRRTQKSKARELAPELTNIVIEADRIMAHAHEPIRLPKDKLQNMIKFIYELQNTYLNHTTRYEGRRRFAA